MSNKKPGITLDRATAVYRELREVEQKLIELHNEVANAYPKQASKTWRSKLDRARLALFGARLQLEQLTAVQHGGGAALGAHQRAYQSVHAAD